MKKKKPCQKLWLSVSVSEAVGGVWGVGLHCYEYSVLRVPIHRRAMCTMHSSRIHSHRHPGLAESLGSGVPACQGCACAQNESHSHTNITAEDLSPVEHAQGSKTKQNAPLDTPWSKRLAEVRAWQLGDGEEDVGWGTQPRGWKKKMGDG